MKYKIELDCWDYGNSKPYKDEMRATFEDYKDAMIALLTSVVDELGYLNDPMCDNPDRRCFVADLEGGDGFDAVVRCWDGADYMNVTGYKIITAEEN